MNYERSNIDLLFILVPQLSMIIDFSKTMYYTKRVIIAFS